MKGKQVEDVEWLDFIRANPQKYPVLSGILDISESQPLTEEQLRGIEWRSNFRLVARPAAAWLLLKLLPTIPGEKAKDEPPNMERRRFLKTLALGTAGIGIAKGADIATTREGISQLQQAIRRVHAGKKFRTLLPEGVRQALNPAPKAIGRVCEGNPSKKEEVYRLLNPRRAAARIALETAVKASYFAAISTVIGKEGNRVLSRRDASRRIFGWTSAILSARWAKVAVDNAKATRMAGEGHKKMSALAEQEVETLHLEMTARRSVREAVFFTRKPVPTIRAAEPKPR